MQNQEILEIIKNLKGRRSYEEKKASKLGFSSLYAYFEDKIYKEKQTEWTERASIKIYGAKFWGNICLVWFGPLSKSLLLKF